MRDFKGPWFHSSELGPLGRLPRQEGRHDRRRRQRLPDRADDRPGSRAAERLPAHRAVDVPESELPRARSATASAGRCATCRTTAAGSASCIFWPACDGGLEGSASTPTGPTSSARSAQRNDMTRQMFTQWIESQVGDDPELLAKVIPDYPGDRQAHPAGQRQLADGAQARQRRARPRRDRPHRRAAGSSRSPASATRPTSSCTRPASTPTGRCGPCRSPAAARTSASCGARARRPISASRFRAFPTSSACTGRAPTSPTAAA